MNKSPMGSKPIPSDLNSFIETVHWTYARTMPEWSHEYIVRERVDESLFVKLVNHIRDYGYEGKFYSKSITYFDHEGMTYWTMGAPIDETIILNRCRKEDTYEVRKSDGRLSDN